MPLVNAFSKAVVRDFSLEELEQATRLMRGYDLVALCAAGSGHAGGTLSIMDIAAALYLRVADHDPENPNWPDSGSAVRIRLGNPHPARGGRRASGGQSSVGSYSASDHSPRCVTLFLFVNSRASAWLHS